jgi:hypothetical protein
MYVHTSTAVCANCRGKCAYQLIGQAANPISNAMAQPISVSTSLSSASRQPAGVSTVRV